MTVLAVAKRARRTLRGDIRQVPRLRLAARRDRPPTVWMVCPDYDEPSGGIRRQYRTVDLLNEAGIPAAIMHRRAGFACSWFEHRTRIVTAGEIGVSEDDVIAVPEIYGASILDLPVGVRQVIFNQNAYMTLESLTEAGPAAAAPYVDNPDLAAVTVVSDHNAALMGYAFPEAPIHRIHLAIDDAIHHPPAEPPPRRIAYMTRRRADEAAQVLALLQRRGALADWDVVPIDGRSEAEVADLLRASRVFFSLSELEGLGLPPLEALACGCLVAGFDGFAGREFFRAPFATPVENGDVVGFARAAEALLRRIDEDPAGTWSAALAGSRFARERYAPEIERQDLVDVFAPLLFP
jgi:hypothetical protein